MAKWPTFLGPAVTLLALSNGCGGDTRDTTPGNTAETGGSTGAPDTGGGQAGGGQTGIGGGAQGGAGGCVDACELYGAQCCFERGACIEPGNSCVVEVLSASVGTIYDYAILEQTVATLPPDVLVSFTDADIDWAAADPSPAVRIQLTMTPEASALYGATLDGLESHAFRLSCDGQTLFVGVTYLVYGAAALATPVLHVARDAEDRVVLGLGAWQGAWVGFAAGDLEAAARLDRPELRAVFCHRGALEELHPEAVLPN